MKFSGLFAGQVKPHGSGRVRSAASGPGKQPSCAASTSKHSFFSFFFFSSSGGWVKIKLKLPHFQVGLVSMSTRPDPEGSGTVEMTTRRSSPGSVGLVRAHPLTKTQAMEPSRQTWPSYGPPYPLGRWSSVQEVDLSAGATILEDPGPAAGAAGAAAASTRAGFLADFLLEYLFVVGSAAAVISIPVYWRWLRCTWYLFLLVLCHMYRFFVFSSLPSALAFLFFGHIS